MSARIVGYFYLTLAMVLVGSTVIASKIIAAGLPPFTATACRFVFALPLFYLLMRFHGAVFPNLSRHDWLILVLQAGAGSVGYTTLLISGLKLTAAADAGVIIGTLPIVSAVIAIILLGERPRPFLLLAIALAGLGVLSIAVSTGQRAAHSLAGNLLIFCAIICEGLFILLNKRLKTAIPPLTLSTLMAALGLVVAIVPCCYERPWAIAIDLHAVLAVLYYALVPTVGGYLLWYAGSTRVSGSEASLFTALAPVSAVFFAVIVLHESVGMSQIVGIGCVLVAVVGLGVVTLTQPVTTSS